MTKRKEKRKKGRRKGDGPVKIGKIEMSSRTFVLTIIILCMTGVLLFSAVFEIDLGFMSCKNQPQKIPTKGAH